MAKDPAFSFYAQDYLVDTIQWSRGQKGLHIDLLCISWINGHLEADQQGRPVGLSAEDKQYWDEKVKTKWKLLHGKLTNPKQEESREKRAKFLESQREKGKISVQKKREKIENEKKIAKKSVKSEKKVPKKKEEIPPINQPKTNQNSTPVEPRLNHLKTKTEKEKENELETSFEEGAGETFLEPEISWSDWVDEWFEFYKRKHDGISPQFNVVQATALKRIKAHLMAVAKEKTPDQPPEKAAFKSWTFILSKWEELDPWLQTQFDLTVISKKINDVINRIKNGTPKNNRNSAPAEINTPRAFSKIDRLFAED